MPTCEPVVAGTERQDLAPRAMLPPHTASLHAALEGAAAQGQDKQGFGRVHILYDTHTCDLTPAGKEIASVVDSQHQGAAVLSSIKQTLASRHAWLLIQRAAAACCLHCFGLRLRAAGTAVVQMHMSAQCQHPAQHSMQAAVSTTCLVIS
jgi:hypothetical protein